MREYIKGLIRDGFKVYLLDFDQPDVAIIPKEEKPDNANTEAPKTRKKYVKKNPNGNPPSLLTPEIVENMRKKKTKRINWKTIAKIKQMKEDGLTSGRISDKLGVELEVINKYWDKE